MSINVSSSAQSQPITDRKVAETKPKEIQLFSNSKVATDINNIAARYGNADFDDAREFTALGEYINKFKANLSSGVQRFLNGILNRTASYTAEQIEEMASHTDKATKERVTNSVNEFSGTMEILSLLKAGNSDNVTSAKSAEELWANAASYTDKATAERTENFVKALSNIEPGTLEIIGLISD